MIKSVIEFDVVDDWSQILRIITMINRFSLLLLTLDIRQSPDIIVPQVESESLTDAFIFDGGSTLHARMFMEELGEAAGAF